jgi:hypothetical protein
MAGVSAKRLKEWLDRAEAGEQPYTDFAEALERADLECEAALVEKWRGAAPEDWRAGKEFLARRFPERWGAQTDDVMIGFGGVGGLTINLNLNVFKREEPEAVSPQRAIDVTPPKPPPKDPNSALN